jgi:signal-induced proliferation-associated 1 like protein 3
MVSPHSPDATPVVPAPVVLEPPAPVVVLAPVVCAPLVAVVLPVAPVVLPVAPVVLPVAPVVLPALVLVLPTAAEVFVVFAPVVFGDVVPLLGFVVFEPESAVDVSVVAGSSLLQASMAVPATTAVIHLVAPSPPPFKKKVRIPLTATIVLLRKDAET